MAVSPTGIESTVLDTFRTTLATSDTFQTWVGVETVAAAKARIYPVKETAGNYTLPCAVIDVGPIDRNPIAVGISEQRGSIEVLFMASVDSEHDDDDAAYAFLNQTGAVISDVEALVGTGGYTNITGVRRPEKPQRTSEDEAAPLGDAYLAQYTVDYWGA